MDALRYGFSLKTRLVLCRRKQIHSLSTWNLIVLRLDVPLISLALRTLQLNLEKLKLGNNISVELENGLKQAEKNLSSVLIKSYQLFRQFILTSLMKMNLFSIVSCSANRSMNSRSMNSHHLEPYF